MLLHLFAKKLKWCTTYTLYDIFSHFMSDV